MPVKHAVAEMQIKIVPDCHQIVQCFTGECHSAIQRKYLNFRSFLVYLTALQKMPGDPEVDNLDTELTRLEVGVRQMVQDFPLCATFREIDQQNALVRGELDSMREKLVRLDTLALEQVHTCLHLP